MDSPHPLHPMSLTDRLGQLRPSTLSTVHRVLVTTWGVLFLAAVLYWTNFPGDDPYRCRAVVETGRWIDPPDENGDRLPFAQWQPHGCLMNNYTSEDVRQCMDGRHIVFSGDSTVRQVFYGLGRILQRNASEKYEHDLPRRVMARIQYHGVNITYVPNPYLLLSGRWDPYNPQTPDSSNLTALTEEFDWFMQEQENSISIEHQKSAALVMIGGGPWFALGTTEEARQMWMDRYTTAVTNVSDYLGGTNKDAYNAPLDPIDGRGNQLLFIPPSGPCLEKNSSWESGESWNKTHEIIRYQNWLSENSDELSFNFAWALPATVFDQNKTFVDPLFTGWHYIPRISEERANILLNFRCNAKLDRINKNPSRGNCCTDYGNKPMAERLIVGAGIAFLVICLAFEGFNIATRREAPAWPLLNMQAGGALVLPLLMSYYADRTQLMAKGGQLWEPISIHALCFVWATIGFFSVWKSLGSSSENETDGVEIGQSTFLSKSQMDEWKGWMILVVISAHWVNGDQSVPLRIITEVLMSSFLFLIGYEHTTHFLVNQDFSLAYGARVLLRLNLLTGFLCHFSNTTYFTYIYITLINFYFVTVWATMAFGHHLLNNNTQLIVAKVCTSAAIMTWIVKFTPIINWTFYWFSILFNVHWDAELWGYYFNKDLYIAYAGMLLAIANHENKGGLGPVLRYTLAVVGAVTLTLFWSLWTHEELEFETYIPWHSLMSYAPILAYIALRNASITIRGFHSRALAYVGECYLEIYVLHHHLFLAADGHGVLLTGAFTGDGSLLGDRWRDLIILVPIFIWVSSCAASGTMNVANILMPAPSLQVEDEVYIPLPNYEDEERDSSSRNGTSSDLPPSSDTIQQKPVQTVSVFEYINKVPSSADLKSLFLLYGRLSLVIFMFFILSIMSPAPPNQDIPDGETSAWHDPE